MSKKVYKVVIVDDHMLLSQAIAGLVDSFANFEVKYLCKNGKALLTKLKDPADRPDIILMDVRMPIVDGIEATRIVSAEYPSIKVLALSIEEEEGVIIRMLKAGAKGYLLKDVEKEVLHKALIEVLETGYYHTKHVSEILVRSLHQDVPPQIKLKPREMEFLKLACSEMTYQQIADKMYLSPKTIDGYREALFQKLNVKNRIGLVMFAIKEKLVVL